MVMYKKRSQSSMDDIQANPVNDSLDNRLISPIKIEPVPKVSEDQVAPARPDEEKTDESSLQPPPELLQDDIQLMKQKNSQRTIELSADDSDSSSDVPQNFSDAVNMIDQRLRMRVQMKKLQDIKKNAQSKLDSDKASMKSEVEKMSDMVSVQIPANSDCASAAQSSTLLDMSTSSKREAYKNMRRMKDMVLKAPPPRARPESASLQSAESDFVQEAAKF